ncbi:MAG: recombinase family protein [Candidatus Sedimenticola sp. 6PFRAG1]
MQRDQSIEDQVRICTQYAEREGWEVVEKYSDKGISGSKTNRPGYQALLSAARDGLFDVVVCEDVSRLWRDEAEQARCVKELQYLERHIVGVNDGIDTRREGFEYLLAIRGAMNAGYRREIGKRTHRGLTGVALEGRSAGGKAYGYRSEYENVVDEKGRSVSKPLGRKIVPEEAHWVRKIFEWYAEGNSPRWIANELNRLGIPSPGSKWARQQRRQSKWVGSAIYGDMTKGTGILNNELYIGRQIWNRSRWVERPDGKKERRERPEGEWVIAKVPELRIVSQKFWERVKERQSTTRAQSKNIREALHKNARTGAGPKYLFSGLLKCGECGSNYVMRSKYHYGCASHTNGGKHACSNKRLVSRKIVEKRLLEGIKHDLFTPEMFREFRRETTRLLAERKRSQQPNTTELELRLVETEREIENIMTAIKAGIITETTKSELERAEREKKRLQDALSANVGDLNTLPDLLPQAMERYERLVRDLENTTQKQVTRARSAIKNIIGGKVMLIEDTEENCLVAELSADFQGLINEKAALAGGSKINLVAGVGFEPTTFGL